MSDNTTKIQLLLMAAGASKRLGQPKQLVKYKGKTLIRRMAEEALKANIGELTVVTGYDHLTIEKEIEGIKLNIYYNTEWEEGLGSSIRNGIKHVCKKHPDTNAILFIMVDQPFVDAAHLQKIANAYDSARPMIIASAYQGTFGVPVLVDNKYFDEMLQLQGDEGGKKIFVKYIKDIVEIPFIEGAIDIDEKKDLKSLN